ncbi:MAG: hypothetical protein MRY83_19220 [Flavobacteriales bacterium]|nr:hypothetical protein [Flavobacteriales bacterium]
MGNYKKLSVLIVFLLLLSLIWFGCKKNTIEQVEETVVSTTDNLNNIPNPYDLIDYGTVDPISPPDAQSIVGLHNNILSVKCANPGCHDGAFEPDFRTVQSSYSTLVYHPIIKNNAAEDFQFRVIPFDTARSVFHERLTNCCFVNVNDIMPQDAIGQGLPQSDIDNITGWIMNGAKNINGTVPEYANLPPTINPYFLILDSATYSIDYTDASNRVDSIFYNPVMLPNNQSVAFIFFVEDDSTATSNLLVNQLKISSDPDDFSNATTYTTTFLNIANNPLHIFWINTADLPQGTTQYMRYYVNDGDQPQNVEFPRDELPEPYKTFWAFIVN